MKIYNFNSNNGEESFITLAENKQEAYNNFIKYLVTRCEEVSDDFNIYHGLLFYWTNANVLDPTTFPEGYTLDEIFDK